MRVQIDARNPNRDKPKYTDSNFSKNYFITSFGTHHAKTKGNKRLLPYPILFHLRLFAFFDTAFADGDFFRIQGRQIVHRV